MSGGGEGKRQRPDFSGRWELDAARSDFGPVPGPSQSTQVIEHEEPVLRLAADSVGFMGEDHVEFEFRTDGSEAVQTVEGRPRRTQSYWDHRVLVTEWEIENPEQPRFEMIDRRSLSEDGQTMIVHRQVQSSWAEWEQKAVYVRQPSGEGRTGLWALTSTDYVARESRGSRPFRSFGAIEGKGE